MKFNPLDRIQCIYGGLGTYMFARYAFQPTCGVSAGFYLCMSLIVSVIRTTKPVKQDIGFELVLFVWSVYEIVPWCYELLVLEYTIFTSVLHLIFCCYYLWKFSKTRENNTLGYQVGLLDHEMNDFPIITTTTTDTTATDIDTTDTINNTTATTHTTINVGDIESAGTDL